MSLLMMLFLINANNVKPLTGYDSLKVRNTGETISEEVDPVLQYTFGMDTYRAGFNKGSISTNTLEEQINTTNGSLELKIKLLSLPMRGNKDYDLYLTYRGSPLSIPGMQVPNPSYKTYGYDAPPYDVEDSLLQGNRNKYIVSSDMGNCGLGWNVMPGELSLNPTWQYHYISGDSCFSERRDGFINLNGGKKYSIYNLYFNWQDDWFISGKRNWKLNTGDVVPILSTPEYTYEFDMYPVEYLNPKKDPYPSRRELYPLKKITDRNGNYVNMEWWGGSDPPEARIPEKICTPTDTCYIYGSSIAVDTNEKSPSYDKYCLWDFWVIDSIVRNVNGEKFKVNFYYHQEWFDMILEYWYGHAFVLLDSVEFLKNGNRIKPPYRFEYDTRYNNSDPERRQGELITLITPDSAEYEYWYAEKSKSCCKYGKSTCNNPYESSYRVVNKKVVTLPDTDHIESGGGSNPDGVYEYEYLFGNSVGPSSGHFWDWDRWVPLTYYPIYDKCTINMPDTGSITYFNIDAEYVENLLEIEWRRFINTLPECMHDWEMILPFEREEFYGRPYKIVTENYVDVLKLEQFYWTISDEVLPCDRFFEWPLHPFLRYKAVQMDPDDDNIDVTEKATVYHYAEYDKYDNEKTVRFLGEAELIGDSSYYIIMGQDYYRQEWLVSGIPRWDDVDPSDNWEVKKDYVYESENSYADAFLYNLVSRERKYKWNYGSDDIVERTDFEYDGKSLIGVTGTPPMHGDAPYSNNRGNLTRKTEWISNTRNRSQQYWYDICGNLVKMKDYMGEEYSFEYDDEAVFPERKIYPGNSNEHFNFDDEGNLVSFTDRSYIVNEFEYDIYGRISEVWKGIPAPPIGMCLLGKYKYDDFNRIASATSYSSGSSSDTTYYYYDNLGRLEMEEFLGGYADRDVLKEYFYDRKGNLNKETLPRFRNTVNVDTVKKKFDVLNRVTEIEYPKSASPDYPGPEIVSYEYDGYTTEVTDERLMKTTLINDAAGNLIQVQDALGNWTNYYYDVNGNLTEIKDAEEKHTYFEYDWLGNLVRREGPDRGEDLFEYYPDGQVKFHWNNAGDKIEFKYDVLGRIKSKWLNNTKTETYYYDSYNNIGGVNYNPPSGLNFPKGRLTGFQNENVREVYFYDQFGDLCLKKVIPFVGSSGEKDIEYSYDLQGRLTELQYPDDYKVNYEYDRLGNISLIKINDGETVNLSSTAAGLLSGIHFPGAVTDTFTYKPRNWMESMEINGIINPYSREFEYHKRGELKKELVGDNCVKAYAYDVLGRLVSEDKKGSSEYDYSFSYDKVGNRKSVNDNFYTYHTENGKKTNKLKDDDESEYTYDENGCLKAKIDGSKTTKFYYDPEGRLISVTLPDGRNGYKYYYKGHQRIREEKLRNIEEIPILESVSYSCKLRWNGTYESLLEMIFLDGNNNEIGTIVLEHINNVGEKRFSGEITKEDFPSGTVNAKLRVRRWPGYGDGDLWVDDMSIDGVWGDGGISGTVAKAYNYFYDNAGNLIMVEEEDAMYGTTKYIHAGNRLIAKLEGPGVPYFYHLDRIGSPIMITDESATVVKEKKYEAFGNIVWEEGTHDDNREFTSKEKEPTGFHYFGARRYYANIGRFLSPDPHTLMPGNIDLSNPQELNPYVYCVNNPLSLYDPDGKQATELAAQTPMWVQVSTQFGMAAQAFWASPGAQIVAVAGSAALAAVGTYHVVGSLTRAHNDRAPDLLGNKGLGPDKTPPDPQGASKWAKAAYIGGGVALMGGAAVGIYNDSKKDLDCPPDGHLGVQMPENSKGGESIFGGTKQKRKKYDDDSIGFIPEPVDNSGVGSGTNSGSDLDKWLQGLGY